jgi:hypothetical protein
MIDTALNLGLAEPEETYSSSEHLFTALNIPAGSNGRMVKAKPAERAVESKPKTQRPVKAEAPARTERTRVRTKKFSS